MARSKTLVTLVTLLGLFLVGTVIVLSTTSYYLAIDATAYLTETEIPASARHDNSSQAIAREHIPRIIHQTWKTDVLPDRWKAVSNTCKTLMPEYEYMLWTDITSRKFIAREYSWFLETFDSYVYPIQRADAIRYFVLHHYGGIYLDLDVGCLRPLDPLLVYPVILPKTIPVGVSNDLMFASKGHPFMAQTIHNLITFDHSWILNYPTVMFSTGPMFLSAQYGLWTSSHPVSNRSPGGDVRILSKALYGKNAKPEEAPHAFFSHHYGSSWHADDAAFVTFLGKWGRVLMYIGMVVLVLGLIRMFWSRRRSRGGSSGVRRRMPFGRYDLLLPTRGWRQGSQSTSSQSGDEDGHGMDLGMFSAFVGGGSGSNTSPPSPTSTSTPPSSGPPSPSAEFALLPVPFDLRPVSPSPSVSSDRADRAERSSAASVAAHAFRRAGTWAVGVPGYFAGGSSSARHSRSRSSRLAPGTSGTAAGGRSYFTLLPAIFTPARSPSGLSSGPSSAVPGGEGSASGSSRLYVPRPHRHRTSGHASSGGAGSSRRARSTSLSRARAAKAAEAGLHLDFADITHFDDEDQERRSRSRSTTPLTMMDPLEGSDVRSSRSASISAVEGLPPPYDRADRAAAAAAAAQEDGEGVLPRTLSMGRIR